MTVQFREVQRPRQWWIAAIVIVVAILQWYVFVQQILRGQTIGDDPMPDRLVWVFLAVFGIAFPLGWIAARLVVDVCDDALLIRYVPFMSRRIDYGDIVAVQATGYRPLRDFGGWGIRWWFGRDRIAYSARGDRGVKLTLDDGRTVIVGSQQPDALASAINAARGARVQRAA